MVWIALLAPFNVSTASAIVLLAIAAAAQIALLAWLLTACGLLGRRRGERAEAGTTPPARSEPVALPG